MDNKYKITKIILSVIGCILIASSVFCFVQSSREYDIAQVTKGTAYGMNAYGNNMSAFKGAFEAADHYDKAEKYKGTGIVTIVVGAGCILGAVVTNKKEKELS